MKIMIAHFSIRMTMYTLLQSALNTDGDFDDNCFGQLLRREIDAALLDRDRTIKEAHELREKLGIFIIIKMTVLKKNLNDDNYRNQTIELNDQASTA